MQKLNSLHVHVHTDISFHRYYVRIIVWRFCSKLGAQSELLLYAFKLPVCHATHSVLG